MHPLRPEMVGFQMFTAILFRMPTQSSGIELKLLGRLRVKFKLKSKLYLPLFQRLIFFCRV